MHDQALPLQEHGPDCCYAWMKICKPFEWSSGKAAFTAELNQGRFVVVQALSVHTKAIPSLCTRTTIPSLQQSVKHSWHVHKSCRSSMPHSLQQSVKHPQILQKLRVSPGANQGGQLIPHGPRKALLLGCSPADDGQLHVLDWGSPFLKHAR